MGVGVWMDEWVWACGWIGVNIVGGASVRDDDVSMGVDVRVFLPVFFHISFPLSLPFNFLPPLFLIQSLTPSLHRRARQCADHTSEGRD